MTVGTIRLAESMVDAPSGGTNEVVQQPCRRRAGRKLHDGGEQPAVGAQLGQARLIQRRLLARVDRDDVVRPARRVRALEDERRVPLRCALERGCAQAATWAKAPS